MRNVGRFAFSCMFVVLVPDGGQAQPQLLTLSHAAYPHLTPDVLADFVTSQNNGLAIIAGQSSVAIKNEDHSGAITDARVHGVFVNGNTAPGTSLQDSVDANAVFSGGIGLPMGVCLSTGFLTDSEPTRPLGFMRVGVEGPNDGQPIDTPANAGEASKVLQASDPFSDEDWAAVHPTLTQGSGDPAVLEFQVELTNPGYLRLSFVFGSDEFPIWVEEGFNDTIAILVRGQCTPANDPGENLATLNESGVAETFSLSRLADCTELFIKNQMSPAALAASPNSEHKIVDPANYFVYFDHEFGGFSRVLTRETKLPRAPGTYTVKFVIQDVADRKVDSALFIPSGSITFFPLAKGDFNGDGVVNAADWQVWRDHFGQSPVTFYDGDGNGDCVVDAADYSVWRDHLGLTGNKDFCADFNRDGVVNSADENMQAPFLNVLTHCASRFEGDADGDGDVDGCDDDIREQEEASGTPSRPCACGGGGALVSAESGFVDTDAIDIALLQERMPASPDLDGNGEVSAEELAELDALMAELSGGSAADAFAADESDEAAPAFLEPVADESNLRDDSPHPSDFPGDSPRETSLLVAAPRN